MNADLSTWATRTRVALLATVVLALVVLAALGGWAGLFSSAERRLTRELLDPATRLSAATLLADQYTQEIVSGHPTIPGAAGERTCPAAWAVVASTIVGELTPADATQAMLTARRRFGSAGWKVAATESSGATVAFSARQRRGLSVRVSEQVADAASTLELTLTVPCPNVSHRQTGSR